MSHQPLQRLLAIAGMTLLLLSAVACGQSSHKNIIFIVDTSGSMKMSDLLTDVKASMKNILKDLKQGDNIHLLTFDGTVRNVLVQSLGENLEQDKAAVQAQVDAIVARGQNTDLVAALDHSLNVVKGLKVSDPDGKNVLVLYTDGKHDPAPNSKNRDIKSFAQLIKAYYGDYVPGDSWFIFYVELNEPDPELKEFLAQSKSGKVITKDNFSVAINFTEPDKTPPEEWAKLFGMILLVIIAGHYVLPWFGKAKLVQMNGRKVIELGSFRRRLFRRHLRISSLGDISIPNADAKIGVTLGGSVYLEPMGSKKIEVDGKSVDFRVILYSGQSIQLGMSEYEFKK